MSITLCITEEADLQMLKQSVIGYRNANVALDKAIELESWSGIDLAQNTRQMHAHTIALIVNKFAVEGEV